MDKDDFIKYLDGAFEDLQVKQKALQDNYQLDTYEEYALDLDNRRLIFSSTSGNRIVFDFLVIGSFAPSAGSFLWGWADGTLGLETRQNAEKLKALSVVTGLEIFQQDRVDSDENMAVELSVLSINLVEALGLYRIPGEDYHRFLALLEVITS